MSLDVYPAPSVTDYWLAIAKGEVPGHSVVNKFGRNPSVPNGSWAGVLSQGGLFPWLTAATTVRIKAGGNAADTAAGLGAQSILVTGLDGTGAEISEIIVTAGASASASTSLSFLRPVRAYVVDAGTYGGSCTGTITIENTAGTQDLLELPAGFGQTLFCGYSIPLGYTGYLVGIDLQSDAVKTVDFRLKTRANLLDVTTPFSPALVKYYWAGILGTFAHDPPSPLLTLQPLTDIWVEAYGGGAITEVSAQLEILLVLN